MQTHLGNVITTRCNCRLPLCKLLNKLFASQKINFSMRIALNMQYKKNTDGFGMEFFN